MSLQIEKFLGTAVATTVGTTAAELFATPATFEGKTRTGFLIQNCDATATDILYVSDKPDVSSTNRWYAMLPTDPQPQYIPWRAGTKVYIIGSTSSVSYRAQEVIAKMHV